MASLGKAKSLNNPMQQKWCDEPGKRDYADCDHYGCLVCAVCLGLFLNGIFRPSMSHGRATRR